jgi:hypothetical protein
MRVERTAGWNGLWLVRLRKGVGDAKTLTTRQRTSQPSEGGISRASRRATGLRWLLLRARPGYCRALGCVAAAALRARVTTAPRVWVVVTVG